ncbi:Phosphoribosylanthranilate isomerase [Anaeromyxobacter dehalogenans 2CP-1]|uniref:N-(5'-phosphoribosyl)anthranilate isomerase n=1 Tax=Anaeromyxobacter dehalogenans (strain ATCC BAA-258 / DSM 21875 / 2CP-1) TaxID=455488 RepID=B8JAL7_ANAD2|nr:phosphoribosylanthranilate isomerase [Anaeromyxobacter dehalogenans]ACL67516.1 Phosphoribosylanthranilate isomerase [Anaeromyxobacter dehalogenans 2CP-1]
MAPPPRVKICGVTRLEDALEAARLGADAVGFNFWPRSKRYVPPATARALVAALPPFVTAVGVFVDPTREELLAAVAASGVQVAQLHGDEPPELLEGLPFPVVKAIRVGGPEALDQLARYPAAAGFLLDSASPGYGGSGVAFDWALAARAAERTAVVLAGGLTPANVADAIRAVRPWAVDVASGVESAPGVKDRQLMARFVRAAKETT